MCFNDLKTGKQRELDVSSALDYFDLVVPAYCGRVAGT